MAKKDNNQNEGSIEIQISHGKLHHELEPSVRIIGELNDIDSVDTVMNIVKTRKNIDATLDIYLKARKKMVEDMAEKTEDGKPLTKKSVQRHPLTGVDTEVEILVYKDDATQRDANFKAQKLDEKEIKLEIFPITYMEIKECKGGISPNIIIAAGEFLKI